MNKRDSLLVAVLGIITAAVIMAGFTYSRDRRAELLELQQGAGQSQTAAFEERRRKQEEAEKSKFLGAFTENREAATVADFLQYLNYEKEATTVVYYGDITENTSWTEAGLSEITQNRDLENVQNQYVSLGEGTPYTSELDLAKVAGHQPDVVFLALPQTTEVIGEESLQEAELEIFRAYDAIKADSPDALVVLLAPAPSSAESVAEDAMKSALQGYVEHMQAASGRHSVGFYNLHAQVRENVRTSGGEIQALYNEEQALTPEGNLLMQQAFVQNLEETPVDTRNAFHAEGKKQPAASIVPEEAEESSSDDAASMEESLLEESEQEAAERAAAESAAAEAAEQASLEQAASEQAAAGQAAQQSAAEQAAAARAASEQAAAESWAAQEAARQQAAREQAAREQAAREQAAREQAIRESQEQARREQEEAERISREKEEAERASSEEPPAPEGSSSSSGIYFEDRR